MSRKVLIIVALILAVLVQTSVFFIPIKMIDGYFLIIKPMFWLILLGFVLAFYEKKNKPSTDKQTLLFISILGIMLYVLVMFISGFFLGYSRNSMDTTFLGIIRNFWTYIPIIIAKEYTRSRIMLATNKKNKYLVLFVVALVFTYLSIESIRSVVTLNLIGKLDYLMTTFLPLLFLNLFLSYAALKGALSSNLLLQFIYTGIPVFMPVLPNIPKIFEAIMLYTAIFIMYIIYDRVLWDRKRKKEKNKSTPDKYHWKWMIAPAIILGFCLLFALGVFPYIPLAVASNSMQGEFGRGDVVLVKKYTLIDEIKEGQIIQFRSNNRDVVHRVVQMYVTPQGSVMYVTKGDNNDIVDSTPVSDNQVIGVVEYKIPYIGWPALLFSR